MRSEQSLKILPENIRCRIFKSFAPKLSCSPLKAWRTNRLPNGSVSVVKLPANGEKDFLKSDFLDWKKNQESGAHPLFPPQIVVHVKALACELPSQRGIPLSRFSSNEIAREVMNKGIVAKISGATVWRWLSEDAIKPWQHKSWIYPRDQDFETKAARVLDLYQGIWKRKTLGSNDFVISADEKTSIQARIRKHETKPPAPGQAMRVEHEYKRGGALVYLAAWDVHQAKIFGRCENRSGKVAFDNLIADFMAQEPYHSAKRVFLVIDNGSSHRGQTCIERLTKAWPNIVPVHLPVHASWLNQIEVYFSIVQRKVLTPNDFESIEEIKARLIDFQERYQLIAKPFQWKFTRKDLSKLLQRLSDERHTFKNAA
jgi:hypothetical protein